MKKFNEIIEVVENNWKCVILEVKPNSSVELLKTGCFSGTEKTIVYSKDKSNTILIINNDGTDFSWGRNTICSESLNNMRDIIHDCIEHEFNIYCGQNPDLLRRSLEQYNGKRDIKHTIEFMISPHGICTHKDNEYYTYFNSVELGKKHFVDLGFTFVGDYTTTKAETGIDVITCHIEKKFKPEIKTNKKAKGYKKCFFDLYNSETGQILAENHLENDKMSGTQRITFGYYDYNEKDDQANCLFEILASFPCRLPKYSMDASVFEHLDIIKDDLKELSPYDKNHKITKKIIKSPDDLKEVLLKLGYIDCTVCSK